MKKYFFYTFLLLFLSCKENTQKNVLVKKQPAMSIIQKHVAKVVIDPLIEKEISSWKSYIEIDEKLMLFKNISANEALNNALDLAKITKDLKNGIDLKVLKTQSFKTRINVLENEVLRLKDMTFITAITAKEVHEQVQKIMDAFDATKSKINAVFTKLRIDKEIEIQN